MTARSYSLGADRFTVDNPKRHGLVIVLGGLRGKLGLYASGGFMTRAVERRRTANDVHTCAQTKKKRWEKNIHDAACEKKIQGIMVWCHAQMAH